MTLLLAKGFSKLLRTSLSTRNRGTNTRNPVLGEHCICHLAQIVLRNWLIISKKIEEKVCVINKANLVVIKHKQIDCLESASFYLD